MKIRANATIFLMIFIILYRSFAKSDWLIFFDGIILLLAVLVEYLNEKYGGDSDEL